MNNEFFNYVDVALAPSRLDAYRQDAPGHAVTLARYLLNMAVCESLYSPLQIVEIALRNAVHRHLTTLYGTDAWYDHPNIRLLSGQSAQVADARDKLVAANKPITPGRMVAELSFGFWTGFFNHAHSRTGLGAFLAGQVFPHAPRTRRDFTGFRPGGNASATCATASSIMNASCTGPTATRNTPPSLKPSVGCRRNFTTWLVRSTASRRFAGRASALGSRVFAAIGLSYRVRRRLRTELSSWTGPSPRTGRKHPSASGIPMNATP
jgi:hypothetical protein